MTENEKTLSKISGREGATGEQAPGKKHTKIARHGADMIMTRDPEKEEKMLSRIGIPDGFETPVSLEDRVKLVKRLISQAMGIPVPVENVPDKIGFNLTTDSQRKILFAVLQLMTETNYQGDVQVPNSQVLKKRYDSERPKQAETQGFQVIGGTHIGGAYENIPSTPIVRITRADLMRRAGFDPDGGSDLRDFSQGLSALTINQNFLMWTRFKRDEKGRIVRDKNGRTEFELVSTFSPTLNINFVQNPKTKVLEYYEISPAPVFLDEISREYGGTNGGYFLLIPEDSYQEVSEAYKRRYPSRRGFPPSVIQALCFWFRLQVQDIQQKVRNPFTKNKSVPSQIQISFHNLCKNLDYGDEYIRKHRKRIVKFLDDGISIALELGYLTESSFDVLTDEYLFDLNIDYYPSRYKQGVEEPDSQENDSR